jgi:glyoxylase-like metal-dependent hydrolase (beta-lactamase superfamily II)
MQFDFVTIIPDTLFMVLSGNPMWPSPANSYIIKDGEGFILIDCGYGDRESYLKFVKFLSENGFNIENLKTVIFSHAHPDHMGGGANILSSIKCRTLISGIEAPAARDPAVLEEQFDIPMAKESLHSLKLREVESFDLLEIFNIQSCPMCSIKPDGITSEGDVIQTERLHLEVIYTPGHSPGHISLYNPDSKLLLSGDIIGEILPWYSPTGGGAIDCFESLDKIEKLPLTRILPSHGGVIHDTSSAIKRMRDVLLNRNEKIKSELRSQPKSLLQLVDKLFRENTRFFPGIAITKSHLIWLETKGEIKSDECGRYFLV